MATLPRLRPRNFYDLVVEVALIRPGPIQGGSVHPYIRRRNGKEPVTYLHPLLEPSLAKTLGIPLFQEQLMQMAIDVAGLQPQPRPTSCAGRWASKRSAATDGAAARAASTTGMAAHGITGEVADEIFEKLAAFANYGFPESHSMSFAYLVYASAWFKLHHPAAFCAGAAQRPADGLLLAAVAGAATPRRHGVEVHRPDLVRSEAGAVLEPCAGSHHDVAVRLGLGSVRGIGSELAEEVVAEREPGARSSMPPTCRAAPD